MQKLALALIAAAASLSAAGTANAQAAGGSQSSAPAPSPGVTVQGPERMVCRAQMRTATRMRSSRVCRTVREWEEARASRSQDEELAAAADTLEVLGEKVSTNCLGGMGGPR